MILHTPTASIAVVAHVAAHTKLSITNVDAHVPAHNNNN